MWGGSEFNFCGLRMVRISADGCQCSRSKPCASATFPITTDRVLSSANSANMLGAQSRQRGKKRQNSASRPAASRGYHGILSRVCSSFQLRPDSTRLKAQPIHSRQGETPLSTVEIGDLPLVTWYWPAPSPVCETLPAGANPDKGPPRPGSTHTPVSPAAAPRPITAKAPTSATVMPPEPHAAPKVSAFASGRKKLIVLSRINQLHFGPAKLHGGVGLNPHFDTRHIPRHFTSIPQGFLHKVIAPPRGIGPQNRGPTPRTGPFLPRKRLRSVF